MKHRNWFTLIVRLVGILFIGLSITNLLNTAFSFFISIVFLDISIPTNEIVRSVMTIVGYLAQLSFGLYLLFGGERLIDWCLRSAERMPSSAVCIHCGYDLSMSKGKTCSECGKDQPSKDKHVSAAATDDGDAS